jgi:hypothetical protein
MNLRRIEAAGAFPDETNQSLVLISEKLFHGLLDFAIHKLRLPENTEGVFTHFFFGEEF